jgi:hypothetical protein
MSSGLETFMIAMFTQVHAGLGGAGSGSSADYWGLPSILSFCTFLSASEVDGGLQFVLFDAQN